MHYIRTSFAVMAKGGNKKAAPRMGAQSTSGAPAPCGIYPTKPGGYNDYVYIFCSRANPEHWDRLLKVIGREELIGDPRFATNEDRNENEGFINEIITEWTKNHTKEEAMQIIGAAGVPAGAVHDTLELQNDESFDEARHHADDAAPGRRLEVRDLAGPLRRQAARIEAVAEARPAHRRGVRPAGSRWAPATSRS